MCYLSIYNIDMCVCVRLISSIRFQFFLAGVFHGQSFCFGNLDARLFQSVESVGLQGIGLQHLS